VDGEGPGDAARHRPQAAPGPHRDAARRLAVHGRFTPCTVYTPCTRWIDHVHVIIRAGAGGRVVDAEWQAGEDVATT